MSVAEGFWRGASRKNMNVCACADIHICLQIKTRRRRKKEEEEQQHSNKETKLEVQQSIPAFLTQHCATDLALKDE